MTFLSAATLLFFLMDPFGNLPLVNALVGHMELRRRVVVIIREAVIALVIMLFFLFVGRQALSMLGLEPATLQLGGGIVLLLIAVKMVFPGSGVGVQTAEVVDEPMVVPLAMPLIAGPSTLALILLLSAKEPDKLMLWCGAISAAWLGSAVILLVGTFLQEKLGSTFLRAIERLIGMLLILLAVQMLANGVRAFMAGQ